MKDMAGIKDESFISSVNDYVAKIDFQLAQINNPGGYRKTIMSTWPETIDELLDDSYMGKFADKAERAVKSDVKSWSKSDRSLEAAVKYVRNRFKWNGVLARMADSFKDFESNGTGNSASMNLYLVGLLRALGYQAFPVLLSTRSHGKVYGDYPFMEYFNHVIVYVSDSVGKVLDASNDRMPYDRVPSYCFNGQGLLLKKNKDDVVNWVELYQPVLSSLNQTLSINLSNDSATADIVLIAEEYEAFQLKDQLQTTVDLVSYLKEKRFNSVEATREIENDNLYRYGFAASGGFQIDTLGNKLIIPGIVDFEFKKNPFTSDSRNYPVDMTYPKKRSFRTIIQVPTGTEVVFLPENVDYTSENMFLKYSANQRGNLIEVNASYQFSKAVFLPSEYSRLKHAFGEIVKYFNQDIVISVN